MFTETVDITVDLPEHIWNRVDRSGGPGACWPWTAGRFTNGYGGVWIDNRMRKAQRVVWESVFGRIPRGLLVLHRCDNPPCCNPGHLFLGTHKDNSDDKIAKGRHWNAIGDNHWTRKDPERWAAVLAARSLSRGESHVGAKLTDAQVDAIRVVPQEWGVNARLAREYGVSAMTISRIRRGVQRRSNIVDVPGQG